MLSAQRKEIDEDPKKAASPYPKDFVRWYALDYFKRPGRFRTRRYGVTLATTAFFTLLTAATMLPALHRTHQAAPVSRAHAMFNQQCSNCHTETLAPLGRWFGCADAVAVSDTTCNECHHGATHRAKSSPPPTCVTCHREHAGHEVLASHVPSRHCAECHGDLPNHLKAGETTLVHPKITNFNLDHPEFKWSAPEKKDLSKIKFNHKKHLDLPLNALRGDKQWVDRLKGVGSKLECIHCHQMDDARRYLQPIQYDKHCADCHQLNVALMGDFAPELKPKVAEFSKTPLPHREPEVVRGVLRDRLVEFAQRHAVVSGKVELPRPLPWQASMPVSKEHWGWTTQQQKQAEDLLFMNKQWSKMAPLTRCSHCHIESAPNERVNGLPAYHETKIPRRWHENSVFSHGAHRMMSCTSCHDRNAAGVKVADSQAAADILLPTIKSCQECHRPNGRARNACVECHRYHDRTQQRDPNGWMEVPDGVWKNR